MIVPFDERIDYLIKFRKERKPLSPKEEFEEEKRVAKDFVVSFNEEAKKQGSRWFAETRQHTGFKGDPFILTHLCKSYGWWSLRSDIRLHVSVSEDWVSFVQNDYAFSEFGVEQNRKVFKYLPELNPILEKIPQAVFILPLEEISNFEGRLKKITDDIKEIEDRLGDK